MWVSQISLMVPWMVTFKGKNIYHRTIPFTGGALLWPNRAMARPCFLQKKLTPMHLRSNPLACSLPYLFDASTQTCMHQPRLWMFDMGMGLLATTCLWRVHRRQLSRAATHGQGAL
jgi:hypothetical protein